MWGCPWKVSIRLAHLLQTYTHMLWWLKPDNSFRHLICLTNHLEFNFWFICQTLLTDGKTNAIRIKLNLWADTAWTGFPSDAFCVIVTSAQNSCHSVYFHQPRREVNALWGDLSQPLFTLTLGGDGRKGWESS